MHRSESMSGQSRLRFPVRLAAMAAFAMLGLAAIAGRPALADDNKMYPGSFCQLEDTGTDVRASATGAMYNYASFSHHVNCPILRDRTTNTDGTDDVWVNVNRSGAAGTLPLSCTFYSIDGNTGAVVYFNSASTTATGWQKLVIPVSKSASYGPYSLHCTIPIASQILDYQLSEHLPTG